MTDKVPCRTPTGTSATNVPAWKFDACRDAILAELADGPMRASAIAAAAGRRLGHDAKADLGSLGWHMTTVRLEMEVRGEIARLPRIACPPGACRRGARDMSRSDVVDALIEHQGTLYSEAMGANIARDTPQELFHWLIGAILMSARIDSGLAVASAAALREAGLHKIDAILEADEARMHDVLTEGGYARYREVTTGYLKETAAWAKERYGGDLRRLRDEAGDAQATLKALQEAKGLGATGAGIFAREAQLVWDVFHPRADGPALDAAGDLGLPKEARALTDLAGSRERFVRLLAALTRAALDGPADAVRDAAS